MPRRWPSSCCCLLARKYRLSPQQRGRWQQDMQHSRDKEKRSSWLSESQKMSVAACLCLSDCKREKERWMACFMRSFNQKQKNYPAFYNLCTGQKRKNNNIRQCWFQKQSFAVEIPSNYVLCIVLLLLANLV